MTRPVSDQERVGTAWWHKRSARRLQREIDALG
jgi:hypothetical protein